MNMFKQIINILLTIVLFILPQVIFAQATGVPTFGSTSGTGVCDTCAPIDQQTLLLASSGVAYAIHKIRSNRKK